MNCQRFGEGTYPALSTALSNHFFLSLSIFIFTVDDRQTGVDTGETGVDNKGEGCMIFIRCVAA